MSTARQTYGRGELRYWVFHEQQLAKALSEHESAAVQLAGVDEALARERTRVIAEFLAQAKSLMGGARG